MIQKNDLKIFCEGEKILKLNIECLKWKNFTMPCLLPTLKINGNECNIDTVKIIKKSDDNCIIKYEFENNIELELKFSGKGENKILIHPVLKNKNNYSVILNEIYLLSSGNQFPKFAGMPDSVRVLVQANYTGKILPLVSSVVSEKSTPVNIEPVIEWNPNPFASLLFHVIYDRIEKYAFLSGFETSERWMGKVEMEVELDGTIKKWKAGFDGGDTKIEGIKETVLEDLVLAVGKDPWILLEQYAEDVKNRYKVKLPELPPVTWCSWYPYRMSVTEDRMIENAQIAQKKLKHFGLSVFQIDLGWEEQYLPSMFNENSQFSHGLKWLSEKLNTLGFRLGVWKAPYTISEFDPLYKEHPEWLIKDENNLPIPYWIWYWIPHGNVYILDLTNPEAQEYLRKKIKSLSERGVTYLKTDFINCAQNEKAKLRYDNTIVSGSGYETSRIGQKIMRDELKNAVILNCGGPEMPGNGSFDLLYTCQDTGNTGFIKWSFMQYNLQAIACHLFKNKRWGYIQPSLLVVGLPGGVEESRCRATVAFLAGGQIDISDTLTTLPEDRWQILNATLPPLGITAKPVDLFRGLINPQNLKQNISLNDNNYPEHPAGSVWHLHVDGKWDTWELVGVFSFSGSDFDNKHEISRYIIPFEMIGLEEGSEVCGYEFWSGQYLGRIPSRRENAPETDHGGDAQDLLTGNKQGYLDISFFGPGVKLLCIKKIRSYPWIVGTSFHQSCGNELKDVKWNEKNKLLSGKLCRPIGESGTITVILSGFAVDSVNMYGRNIPFHFGSRNSIVIPVITESESISWSVKFTR